MINYQKFTLVNMIKILNVGGVNINLRHQIFLPENFCNDKFVGFGISFYNCALVTI